MNNHSFRLTVERRDQLVSLIEEYRGQKSTTLKPRLDEVVGYLRKECAISGDDAYQARYIRDCLNFMKDKGQSFQDVNEFIEKKFFPA